MSNFTWPQALIVISLIWVLFFTFNNLLDNAFWKVWEQRNDLERKYNSFREDILCGNIK